MRESLREQHTAFARSTGIVKDTSVIAFGSGNWTPKTPAAGSDIVGRGGIGCLRQAQAAAVLVAHDLAYSFAEIGILILQFGPLGKIDVATIEVIVRY